MKKLLLVILAAVTLQSCDVPVKEVDNPSKLTTLEVIENINPDTVQMSVVGNNVYILKQGKVRYELVNKDKETVQVTKGYIVFLHFILVIFIGGLISLIFGD